MNGNDNGNLINNHNKTQSPSNNNNSNNNFCESSSENNSPLPEISHTQNNTNPQHHNNPTYNSNQMLQAAVLQKIRGLFEIFDNF